MVKRKVLADPTARKRLKGTGEFGSAAAAEENLWGEDAPAPRGRPRNKSHGLKKQQAADRSSAARKARHLPDPAQSYNPVPEQHQTAVSAAAAALLKKEALAASTAAKLRVSDLSVRKLKGDDLTGTEWEEEAPGEPRPEDPKKRRKTRQMRNKSRRLALEALKRKTEKSRNKIVSDIDRIPAIMEELQKEKDASKEKQKKKKELKERRVLNPRIGRRRFKPAVLDLQTADDISPSLRKQGKVLPSMRDPLKLRFEAFRERNIIPAAAPLVRRKPRRPTKYFLVTKTDS